MLHTGITTLKFLNFKKKEFFTLMSLAKQE